MDQSKTSTRLLLTSAVIMLVILVTGPLGYKYGLVPLVPSMMSVLVGVVGGLLVFLAALVLLFVAIKQGAAKDRNLLLVSMVIGLIPLVVMVPQISAARSVPAIHDITTDTINPPHFDVVVPLRTKASNDLIYGSDTFAADAHAAAQLQAYPNVKALNSTLGVEQAVARAESVLRSQGLEVHAANVKTGLVEATDTSFWFGFKDDLVVRVTPQATGSRIDVRSVSRVGGSDIGANARRIERFLQAF